MRYNRLYYTDTYEGTVNVMDYAGNDHRVLAEALEAPGAVAVSSGGVYFIHSSYPRQISRVTGQDNSEVVDVVSTESDPLTLLVQPYSEDVYYTDNENTQIKRLPSGSDVPEVVFTQNEGIAGLTLGPRNTLVFGSGKTGPVRSYSGISKQVFSLPQQHPRTWPLAAGYRPNNRKLFSRNRPDQLNSQSELVI